MKGYSLVEALERRCGRQSKMLSRRRTQESQPVLRLAALLFCLAVVAGAAGTATAFDGHALGRDGLWRIVHGVCAPVSQITGVPLPCLAVDHAKGYAVVRAPDDTTHIIITPLARVSGVESPALQKKDAPNYWAVAWGQRHWVTEAADHPLAWNDLGMAINSQPGRSQDQLHIHVDCVDPRLRQALARAVRSQNGWFEIDLAPWAGRYRARRLKTSELDQNIFRMVALEIPRARDNMADETIAVIGLEDSHREKGFVLLAAGDGGHAEELLDHQCRLARNGSPKGL